MVSMTQHITAAIGLLAIIGAFVDKFVTPDKLPSVPKQPRPAVEPVAPEPDPISTRCQCGCNRETCSCGRTATSCTDTVKFDEAALRKVMEAKPSASVKVPSDELWLFSPTWCPYCKPTAKRLGSGDQDTRLVVKETEAHFVPAGGYPCFYDPKRMKQWTGHPKDMAELRAVFGIVPQTKQTKPEVGFSVGKLARRDVSMARQILGKTGSVQLGNAEINQKFESLTITIPANFKLSWTTDADGKLHVEANPPPKVSWGVLHQDVKSAVIGDKKIDLSLPWAPDVSLDIEEDEHVSEATPRSPKWPAVRAAYLSEHPHCEFKGCKTPENPECHHVKPYHLHPELELDLANLIALCRDGENHHLYVGHQGNFNEENPDVREHARKGIYPAIGLERKRRHDMNPKTTLAP